jgi:hypothetical protein
MTQHIPSHEFQGPFVRVRGRLSRQDTVRWSPCLRTYRAPSWVTSGGRGAPKSPDAPIAAGATPEAALEFANPIKAPLSGVPNPHIVSETRPKSQLLAPSGRVDEVPVSAGDREGYILTFEDPHGKELARAPVRIRFFALDRQWALFTQRLPYYRDTHRVVLWRGSHELGSLVVSRHLPEFVLLSPVKADEVDVTGVMHLKWDLAPAEKPYAKRAPLTYYVRYSADNHRWVRPGVNLLATSFDLDLRQMPGGDQCRTQVIATNGYQTSYVETPKFTVPRKNPEIILAEACGPLLFAQGFSHEEGPLVGKSVEWLLDGKKPIGMGASFDARRIGRGTHQLAVSVTDSIGAKTVQYLGWYEGETGRRLTTHPGY